MRNWREQKEELRKLPPARWLERIKDKNGTTIEEVPTWKDYFALVMKGKPASGPTSADEPDLSKKVSIFKGDITKLGIDCIVNAANNRMLGGGGVDGAIHRAAGRRLYDECKTKNGCPTGEAKITGAYELPAKMVIHTVGPMGEYPAELESCYKQSLRVMMDNQMRTIAFPCISTGVYGYPNEEACLVALRTVKKMLLSHPDKIDRVIFCLFMQTDIDIYERKMQEFFPIPNKKEPNEGRKGDPEGGEKNESDKETVRKMKSESEQAEHLVAEISHNAGVKETDNSTQESNEDVGMDVGSQSQSQTMMNSEEASYDLSKEEEDNSMEREKKGSKL